jgi:hypothetical protein
MTEREQIINGVPVSRIITVVERIERKHGQCHPALLVHAAKSPRSPIHGLFEWDDTEAARQWRVHQARRVLNTITIVVEGVEAPVPAYLHITKITDEGVAHGYMSAARALVGENREGVLRDALAGLQGWRRRYGQLNELAAVWAALDEVEDQVAA